MSWDFDQAPNVACIATPYVMAGEAVLVVTHYDDDGSWAFLDGGTPDPESAMVVTMSAVLDRHPDLHSIADLPPGWTAIRQTAEGAWSRERTE